MPLYEYECPACGARTEEQKKIDGRDEPVYCECSVAMSRVPGNAGFILKGACWSRDNYARVLGDDPQGMTRYVEED